MLGHTACSLVSCRDTRDISVRTAGEIPVQMSLIQGHPDVPMRPRGAQEPPRTPAWREPPTPDLALDGAPQIPASAMELCCWTPQNVSPAKWFTSLGQSRFTPWVPPRPCQWGREHLALFWGLGDWPKALQPGMGFAVPSSSLSQHWPTALSGPQSPCVLCALPRPLLPPASLRSAFWQTPMTSQTVPLMASCPLADPAVLWDMKDSASAAVPSPAGHVGPKDPQRGIIPPRGDSESTQSPRLCPGWRENYSPCFMRAHKRPACLMLPATVTLSLRGKAVFLSIFPRAPLHAEHGGVIHLRRPAF